MKRMKVEKSICSLVMGKAQVATLSVKISVMLRKEFQLPITRETFWTESEAALGYIRN